MAFDDAPNKSEADKSLLLAALWFASQSRALRQTLKPGLDALGGRVSVILAVAALNREFLTASQIAMEGMTQAQAKGALAFDHMVASPLDGGPPGQNISFDDVVEHAVDGVESSISLWRPIGL